MPGPLLLKKHDGFYLLPLFEPWGIRALFTTKKYDMAFEARSKINPPADFSWSHLVRPSQVHGNTVAIVNGSHRGRGRANRRNAIQETDALVTCETRLPIAVLTADCLPVFLADPQRRAIAIVHAGWQGLRQKIISKTVGILAKKFSVCPEELCAVLGPAIRTCCYEVGEEFKGHFEKNISVRSSRLFLDMPAAAVGQLCSCGIPESRIFDSGLCTSCHDDEFYSYRRQGDSAGRSMSVIEIIPK
ncbi:MAG: peptidoglycan editing factor PgeF [Candidatus Omnitrophota bacterium]